MKNKKAVPRIIKGMPDTDAFERMESSVRKGKGRPQKPKPLHKRHRNKHGRQHG
jgi:hypothetical protein